MRDLLRRFRPARTLGARGERYAARWLRRRRYRILHRNYTAGRDEADLIAVAPDGRTLVVVEVKTRSSPDPAPESAFTRDKQHKMFRLAVKLSRRYPDRPIRFDAIAIVWPEGVKVPEVRHYVDAFEAPF